MRGSSTIGQPLRRHRPGAEQADGPVDRVAAATLDVELVGLAADVDAAADLGLVAVLGQRAAPTASTTCPGRRPRTPGARGHRALAGRVGVDRGAHPGDPRVATEHRAARAPGPGRPWRSGANVGQRRRASRSWSTGSTPSGSARPNHSSGSPKRALSRASASVSSDDVARRACRRGRSPGGGRRSPGCRRRTTRPRSATRPRRRRP